MRATAWAAMPLAALALTGCETTAEKSARLQREAKHVTFAQRGLSIAHVSTDVKVLSATLVHSSEAAAAIVTLHNSASRTLRAVPIEITAKDARGRTVFQNDGAGLESALVSVPSIGAHSTLVWVDDQLPANGAPTSVRARVGEAPGFAAPLPRITVQGAGLREDPSNGLIGTGTVSNRSSIAQQKLVVFAVARRGGKVVAAGRAILPELAPSASAAFQVFFVGDARGSELQLSAPPTTLR